MIISVNADNTSPFTEADSTSIIALAAFSKSIKTHSSSLEIFSSIVPSDGGETLVNVHSDNNVALVEDVLEALTVSGGLVKSRFKHNDSTDVLLDIRSSE